MTGWRTRQPGDGQPPFEELGDAVLVALMPGSSNQSQAESPEVPYTRLHGAFGGAIKRRIELTDSSEKYAATNDFDIELLTPLSIQKQLFTYRGDQSFRGVVLTPQELGAVTFSPRTLVARVGANVLANTVERPASERHARKSEVVRSTLESGKAKVEATLSSLHTDDKALRRLAREMKSPGYAHMTGEEMDSLMRHAETVFVSMFEAITTNHGAGTHRVESLTAALEYLLSRDNYRQTFEYWLKMVTVGIEWTHAKTVRFVEVQEKLQQEMSERT